MYILLNILVGCTNVSANLALVTQNLSVVPFMNQSKIRLSYGAVLASLCAFINNSSTSLSYGGLST